MNNYLSIIQKLAETRDVSDRELKALLLCEDEDAEAALREAACRVRQEIYGNKVFIRGLIEFTNYCKNDCYYCGIRCSNANAERYRLTPEEIMECCETGYALGFRTFVLQGGEDPWFNDAKMCAIVSDIRNTYPDCAITLSIGERSKASYQKLFEAGANRYLLRHETANEAHYAKLHPDKLTLKNRMECLNTLKEIGFQVGCGMMIGSPYQTVDDLVKDLRFIQEFQPHMLGCGPFISHHDTPFKDCENGSARQTLRILSILRLMIPGLLLPATTALGTIDGTGREKGMQAGANVVMPNLSPKSHRKDYSLYDNKIATGEEAAEGLEKLTESMHRIGYEVVVDRGDCVTFE